jgi:hypothetical protein
MPVSIAASKPASKPASVAAGVLEHDANKTKTARLRSSPS